MTSNVNKTFSRRTHFRIDSFYWSTLTLDFVFHWSRRTSFLSASKWSSRIQSDQSKRNRNNLEGSIFVMLIFKCWSIILFERIGTLSIANAWFSPAWSSIAETMLRLRWSMNSNRIIQWRIARHGTREMISPNSFPSPMRHHWMIWSAFYSKSKSRPIVDVPDRNLWRASKFSAIFLKDKKPWSC